MVDGEYLVIRKKERLTFIPALGYVPHICVTRHHVSQARYRLQQ